MVKAASMTLADILGGRTDRTYIGNLEHQRTRCRGNGGRKGVE